MSIRFALIIAVALAGCKSNDDFVDANDLAIEQDNTIKDYLDKNNLSADKDGSGFYYITDTANSSGTAATGKIVSIYYTGKILEGASFDDHTPEDGPPVIMEQGGDAILPVGLDLGLALMNEGETFTFILPSALAYGVFEFSTLIPGNSIISIQVTVVQVQSLVERLTEETGIINNYINTKSLNDTVANPTGEVEVLNSGVWYKKLTAGSGTSKPGTGSFLSVNYEGRFLDDKIFDATTGNATFEFNFNTGSVIAGFDNAVANMVEGEKAMTILPSNQAYGASVRVIPGFFKAEFVAAKIIPSYTLAIDPYEILIFDITLRSIN